MSTTGESRSVAVAFPRACPDAAPTRGHSPPAVLAFFSPCTRRARRCGCTTRRTAGHGRISPVPVSRLSVGDDVVSSTVGRGHTFRCLQSSHLGWHQHRVADGDDGLAAVAADTATYETDMGRLRFPRRAPSCWSSSWSRSSLCWPPSSLSGGSWCACRPGWEDCGDDCSCRPLYRGAWCCIMPSAHGERSPPATAVTTRKRDSGVGGGSGARDLPNPSVRRSDAQGLRPIDPCDTIRSRCMHKRGIS
ncbi:uncharacterized protein B0T15DRAFT_190948 [Chaetomium strumarium]|uniref:Uncharacterized protein n=1 Tax=Chaetomium strumarium TaxID=1170767 RepID=A0AAJ0M170_9PEZI|nr:hypothetical protein B0T15DRAFT_190948 [Chaetomium strumarium]